MTPSGSRWSWSWWRPGQSRAARARRSGSSTSASGKLRLGRPQRRTQGNLEALAPQQAGREEEDFEPLDLTGCRAESRYHLVPELLGILLRVRRARLHIQDVANPVVAKRQLRVHSIAPPLSRRARYAVIIHDRPPGSGADTTTMTTCFPPLIWSNQRAMRRAPASRLLA